LDEEVETKQQNGSTSSSNKGNTWLAEEVEPNALLDKEVEPKGE
jgi:hypothetical protein